MRLGGEVVYVAVGANLGDREATFAAVIDALEREVDCLLLAASPVFETEPVGQSGQSAYLNAVLEIRTWLGPLDLLRRLQGIEAALGRDRRRETERWGSREIDLDIVFFGDRCLELPDLIVPHPRAHERAFVMEPLAALAPDFLHPRLGVTAVRIAEARRDPEAVRPRTRPPGWPGARSID